MRASGALALVLVAACAGCSATGATTATTQPTTSVIEPAVQQDDEADATVPFPPSDNIVEWEAPEGSVGQPGEGNIDYELDLDSASSAAYPGITLLDKAPVVLYDDGTRRIELTQAFLVDERELWELTWTSGDRSETTETGIHEPIGQCAAEWLASTVDLFEAELIARAVSPYDDRFPRGLLLEALLACDGRSEILRNYSGVALDRACLQQLSDDEIRVAAGEDLAAAVDLIAHCAQPFNDIPDFIGETSAQCLRDNSERGFRAGITGDGEQELLALLEECLTAAEFEELLAG